MSGFSLGNSNGKLVSTGGAIQSVAKPIDNMALSFNYTGGQWIFSLTNMTPDFQAMLSEGYTVQLQVIRYVGGNRIRAFNRNPFQSTNPKKSHNLKTDITNAVNTTPTSMNLTSFINNLIIEDQDVIPSRKPIAVLNSYNSLGKWFRKYKFCININNGYYATTSDLYIWMHSSGIITNINPSYTYSNGNVNIYPL